MDHEWKGQNKIRIRLHNEPGTASDCRLELPSFSIHRALHITPQKGFPGVLITASVLFRDMLERVSGFRKPQVFIVLFL